MSSDVVTVPESGTLRDAVERLVEHGVGSVIVLSDAGHPTGLVTETDALRAAHRTGQPLREIDVAALTHKPVMTTKPGASISRVASRMAAEDVKKVPVLDGVDLVGIITMTDIVWHLSDIRREAGEIADVREKWDSRGA